MKPTRFHRPTLAGLAAVTFAVPGMTSAQSLAGVADGDWGLDASVTLEGVYFNELSQGNETPAGFGHGHDHDHGHGHDDHGHDHGFDDGFNLGHSELVFDASLGDLLGGTLILGFDDSDVEVEEVYLTTRSLPAGFQIKAGKFLSDIGYINSRHPHDWSFVKRPLVNEYLFGDHGLQETGVQATWVAPLQTYTRLGIELLQGDDEEGIAGFDEGVPVSRDSGPRIVTVFAKIGPDLGPDHAVQYGVSGGYISQVGLIEGHGEHDHALEGDAWFAGLDAAYRHDSGQSYGHGDFKLTGEYFYTRRNLDEYVERGHDDHTHWERRGDYSERQDGLYVEGVYGFAPRWEAGLRTEALGLTNKVVGFHPMKTDSLDISYRHSAQVTFRPVEPVFLRGQLSQNDFVDEHGHRDRGLEFMVQVNVALGAHGAHRF